MEFIGHAYDVKELKSILDELPNYYSVEVQLSVYVSSPVEVYKDESRQEIVLK